MSKPELKSNYTERYYDEVDRLWQEWRRSVWDDSLGGVEQENKNQIGASGWVEVLDPDTGDPIVVIDQDGITWNHHETHEIGGSDEVTVELLITAETNTSFVLKPDGAGGLVFAAIDAGDLPLHADTHEDGGSDEIDVTGLSGLLADPQTPAVHPHDHGTLSGLGDDDHPQYATNAEFDDHSARHENGGLDEISIQGLAGTPLELTNHLNDGTSAHGAVAISFDSTGLIHITATEMQNALEELDAAISAAGGLTDHTHETTGSGADGGGSTLAPSLIDMDASAEIDLGDIAITERSGISGRLHLDGTLESLAPILIYDDFADSFPSFRMDSDSLWWGAGSSDVDVRLVRTGADELTLESGDTFIADSIEVTNLQVGTIADVEDRILQASIGVAFTPAGDTDAVAGGTLTDWITLGNITVPTWATSAIIIMSVTGAHSVTNTSSYRLTGRIGGTTGSGQGIIAWGATADRRAVAWTSIVSSPSTGSQALKVGAERLSGSGQARVDTTSRISATVIFN